MRAALAVIVVAVFIVECASPRLAPAQDNPNPTESNSADSGTAGSFSSPSSSSDTHAPEADDSPSERLLISGTSASTWSRDQASVVQVRGPVTITMDQMTLSADDAVIWLSPMPGALLNEQRAEISLLGHAKIDQPLQGITRSGRTLFVTASVRGVIRISAQDRLGRDLSDSDTYRLADLVRQGIPLPEPESPGEPEKPMIAGVVPKSSGNEPAGNGLSGNEPAENEPGGATTQPAVVAPASAPVDITFDRGQTVHDKSGNVCLILTGNVTLVQRRPNGDLFEMRADHVVVFTPVKNIADVGSTGGGGSGGSAAHVERVNGVYLEGDVRINFTPSNAGKGDQRLEADRVYYDMTSDRAVLTDLVLHTIEPKRQIPIIVRADAARQLSIGEYTATNTKMTTSSFAQPSYSVNSSQVYIHQVDTGDPQTGEQTNFVADNNTFNLFNLPVFYYPEAAGTIDNNPFPLRGIDFGSDNRSSFAIVTDWGLFESLGKLPPKGDDADFSLGYYFEHGPSAGFNASYGGGTVNPDTRQSWGFAGDFHAFFLDDHYDADTLGGNRTNVDPPTPYRGEAQWQHEHFFPDDWQVQIRAGWASDPTFLEEWFQPKFDTDLPHDAEFYLKHQKDDEAFTFLAQTATTPFVTTAGQQPEQFEVDRLPELSYQRLGTSLDDDQLTLYSQSSASALEFSRSRASLADQGFVGISPGDPSTGFTGTTASPTLRADTRDEVDYPFQAGNFKLVPFVFGRYTGYSQGPDGNSPDRVMAGAGLRINTAFWRVDDTAESDLLDIHRLRHIVEPEINLFTSAQTTDRNNFYVYDTNVDAVNDISAVQFALNQTWQTKRGGPGRWRDADVFTLNMQANFFSNVPKDGDLAQPGFRGLYFASMPEDSVPRNSINADGTWRVSDTMAVLADEEWNVNNRDLATASCGVAVRHDPRVFYFVGLRYVAPERSTIASITSGYQISTKYSVSVSQSFDFTQNSDVGTNVTLTRKLDRLMFSISIFHDAINNTNGVRFNLIPEGLAQKGAGAGDIVGGVLGQQ
jgi:lipopolysaccharide export system protein LptA